MHYAVFGPYRLARDGALVSRSTEDRHGLWHMMEADAPGQNVHGAGGFLFPVNANSTVAVASLFTRTVCLSTPDRSCQAACAIKPPIDSPRPISPALQRLFSGLSHGP